MSAANVVSEPGLMYKKVSSEKILFLNHKRYHTLFITNGMFINISFGDVIDF